MARLITSGGEHRDHPTSDVGAPDGYAAGAAMCVTDTTSVRSGQASIQCPGTSGSTSYRIWSFPAPASGTTLFGRDHFWVDALPSATVRIGVFRTSADGALISVRLTSAGAFQLWNDVAGSQIGSDSALVCEVGRIYRWQLRLKIAAGAADEAELLVKADDYQATDEQVAVATGLSISDTHAARLLGGWIDAPGVTSAMNQDDVAVNDSTGTDHNAWPGEGRVVVLLPKGISTLGVGNWTDCSGGANPQNGLDKQPPVGLADHTTAGHTGANAHQARVATNTAQTMRLLLSAWATAGVMWPAGSNPLTLTASTATGTQIGQAASNQRRSMSFVFGAPVTFDEVQLALSRTGSPADNVIVEIQNDSGGLPGGTVLATATIAASSLNAGSATKVKVKLDQQVFPTPGTLYHVVVRRSGGTDVSNYPSWANDGSNATTNMFPDYTPSVFDGTNWLQSGTQWNAGDHVFLITPTQGVYPPTYVTQFLCHGEGVTGVKAGTLDTAVGGVVGLPQKTFNFGDNVGVAGTYPSNWRWAVGAGVRPTPLPNIIVNPNITITKASGSGTNPCLGCAAGVIVEYAIPDPGWTRWQKTADSTFWWALRTVAATSFELSDGSVVTVEAGDWAIYPEPQVDAGSDFPATLTSITTDTLRSGYTLV